MMNSMISIKIFFFNVIKYLNENIGNYKKIFKIIFRKKYTKSQNNLKLICKMKLKNYANHYNYNMKYAYL